MRPIALPVTLLLVLASCGTHADASQLSAACVVSAGQLPTIGNCDGPTERAVVRLSNAESLNEGCPVGELAYHPDDDPASARRCGQCIPGTSGVEDPGMACGLNEYCTDNATCSAVTSSPLYGEPCPYEQGGASAVGWCGPGLRCIEHKCRVCEEGVIDPRDGKRCIDDEWTYSEWAAIGYNPVAILLIIIIVLMLLKTCGQLIVRQDANGRLYIVGLKSCCSTARRKVTQKLRKKKARPAPQQADDGYEQQEEPPAGTGLPYPQYPQPHPPREEDVNRFYAR